MTEREMLMEPVRVPLEEVLVDNDPERVIEGLRVKLGEVDSVEEVEELGQRELERVGERESDGLRDIDGEAVKVLDAVEDTLSEGDGEALELVLDDREFERVSVTVCDNEGEVDIVGESDDEGDREGDLEEKDELEIEKLVERVTAPLEEVLGDNDPERVIEGLRVKLGEVDSVKEVEELGHRVVERVGERERDGLRDIDGDAVNVLDAVEDTLSEGEAVEDTVREEKGVAEGEVDAIELELGD